MKERILSNCEKKFILDALIQGKRLDGRNFDDLRDLELHFGTDFGNCIASLGETKVYSQVSYDIEEPKKTKPNEGLVFINIEVNNMSAPHFDTGKPSNLSVKVGRFLEKGIKESGCIDLEALCIVAEEKVWVVRIDLIVVNYDGNLYTACSVATLASLLDARLPQVKLEDDNIVIYSIKEKSPLPLSLNHFPVAICFALYHSSTFAIADPTDLEDRAKETELVYYVNSFRELCAAYYGGCALPYKQLLSNCLKEATNIADKLVKTIKAAAEDYTKKRDDLLSAVPGIVDCIRADRVLAASQDRTSIKVHFAKYENVESSDGEDSPDEMKIPCEALTVGVIPPKSKWNPPATGSIWSREDESSSSEEDGEYSEDEEDSKGGGEGSEDGEVELVKTITETDRIIDKIELSGDSEEEETAEVRGDDIA